jgi:2-polyprenyl-3-methyl-5-hydroxy-6-metoxy-1,4-benzoquinol methylase
MDEKSFTTQIANTSEDVIDFYNRYASTWDNRFGDCLSVSEFHRIRLESFFSLADIRKTDKLVELGVGTGPYLEFIAPLAAEVICIDGSEGMLKILLEKHSQLNNIQVYKQDLSYSQNNNNFQADIVYCFGLIEHIIDIEVFVENCKSMCKIGGRVIFITTNGLSPWYKIIRKYWRAGRHCTTDRYYTKDQIDKIMSNHSFEPLDYIYWGYFPAGISNFGYSLLNGAGKIIEKTKFRRYAGGLSVSYVRK